jgi:hypothetical protein
MLAVWVRRDDDSHLAARASAVLSSGNRSFETGSFLQQCSCSFRTAATWGWSVSTGERVCEWLQVRALVSASPSIRPLTSIRSFHPILPVLAGAPSGDEHSPVRPVARQRLQLSIAEILQFDCHSHSTALYPSQHCPSLVQTGQT